jgi:rhamnosyltransferase
MRDLETSNGQGQSDEFITPGNVCVIVPVRNGGERWREAAAALRAAVPDPVMVAVVDSSSADGSDEVAVSHGFLLRRIDPRTFNHGRTRQEAISGFGAGVPFIIFLTQDAVVEGPGSLTRLVAAFEDPGVGAAYGRQMPHRSAGSFEAHAALFNYSPVSSTKSLSDAADLGAKTTFLSNSFAAYRASALIACGGFPDHLILAEDAYIAAKMLLAGWRIRYCADARVHHSHAYSVSQEMQRYFDFGVVHAQTADVLRQFGPLEGEGMRFLISEIRYMARNAPWLLPEVAVRNCLKYLGYRVGRNYSHLPLDVCRRMSMTKGYWRGVS